MSQWDFVTAAYGLVGLAASGLVLWAWRSMRAAEAEADAVKRRQ